MSYKRTMRGVDYLIENELDFATEERWTRSRSNTGTWQKTTICCGHQ